MNQLNNDQRLVIDVLKNPSHYIVRSEENGITGLPYKEIMKASNLSLEKTLLSLGSLEAKNLVSHECAVQRQMVDYLGRTMIEITGQKLGRLLRDFIQYNDNIERLSKRGYSKGFIEFLVSFGISDKNLFKNKEFMDRLFAGLQDAGFEVNDIRIEEEHGYYEFMITEVRTGGIAG